MEDTHKAIENVLGDFKQAFFGVFHGHGGHNDSTFIVENIGKNIMDDMVRMKDEIDDILEKAVKVGYLTTNAKFFKQEVGRGTACVIALLIDGNLVASNAGDC
jgi:serine/threonine protein phosphatase PrpC